MSFNHPIIKAIRYLLLPVTGVYAFIIKVRHILFDKKFFHSVRFDRPVICVGNISVGGTGKTPMVEWIIRHFGDKYQLGMVSRGYGRKTKGFQLANSNSTVSEIGDEPLQILQKFPHLKLAVGEERVPAISRLIENYPDTDIILLDDAFQHRWVNASINIVLTTFDELYTDGLLLPTGNLRDLPSAANRAQVIVVTKCPSDLKDHQKQEIRKKLKVQSHQSLFFSYISYGTIYDWNSKEQVSVSTYKKLLLVTGIANPAGMEHYLKQYPIELISKSYPDHYNFKQSDINDLYNLYQSMGDDVIMITTEKDAVRLEKFNLKMKWAVLPIQAKFFDETISIETHLDQLIHQEIHNH